jgi:formimidoylglutamate deiminase
MRYLQFKGLLQTTGWLSPAYVGIDAEGIITYLSDKPPVEAAAVEAVQGYALPGFQNAHSHAFQYAMAGAAEQHAPGAKDDFWSWREAMYQCALSMNPDEVEAVATMLYAELLRKGYTQVAEFHYLHHDKNGKPYNNLAEMGARHIAAAKTAGIKITLVPVFYQKGNFGKPPQERQRRFICNTVDEYLQLLDDTAHALKDYQHARLGYGVHSLRAVEARDIRSTLSDGPVNIPFHLHAAEQLREVDDCIQHLRCRPVEWLLQNLPLSNRFHIVHCTHLTDYEVSALAKTGANVVLCPGTEGNLGDGIFRLTDFKNSGGHWSIGTDSHISLNPLEDLRWLDYAQRFTTHKRNTFDDGASALVEKTLFAGRAAMGSSTTAYFAPGMPLDAVVYNAHEPLLARSPLNQALSTILYTADSATVLGTLVDGQWVVKQGRHIREKPIRSRFGQLKLEP